LARVREVEKDVVRLLRLGAELFKPEHEIDPLVQMR
jgi:hypothetical protein